MQEKASKLKLIDMLEHGKPSKQHLFTLTEERETDADHIVEALHRLITDVDARKLLQPTLYVQVEHCIRDNKSRYIFAYIRASYRKTFSRMRRHLLHSGYTHHDIDQVFRKTSERLRSLDTVTLHDLHTELLANYGGAADLASLKSIASWPELCNKERSPQEVHAFSYLRHFRFTTKQIDE